jgi:hypothetical protein
VYVAGGIGAADTVKVAGFAGLVWGQPTSFTIDVPSGEAAASGPGQTIAAGTTGPDTLVGGYGGDVLTAQNASTGRYGADWFSGTSVYWQDNYQYSQGGAAPGATGISFTESYYENTLTDGLRGSRQYDASSGATSLSWSTNEGYLSGTTSDSGFYGLQNDQEFTTPDPNTHPTFFNPAVSPGFDAFLNGH